MEKYGVIREDLTPPENGSKDLEDHVTRRLAKQAEAELKQSDTDSSEPKEG